MSTGNNVDFTNLSTIAAQLLAQNGNSVHTLTNTLFGTAAQAQAAQQAAPQTTAQASGINLGTLVNLAGALMGGSSSAPKPQPTGASLIDLSDGFDVKDAIGLASLFLANKK